MNASVSATALVTGASGFLGRHAVEALAAIGPVVGVARRAWSPSPGCEQAAGDMTDRAFVAALIERVRPSVVVHLAGTVATDDDAELIEGNVLTTARLLDAVAQHCPDAVVVCASSSAVYGRGSGEPVTEATAVRPLTRYGAAKAAQEVVAARFADALGLRVITVRLFSLVGPGQPATFVLGNAARQIAAAEKGGPGEITLGALNSVRDFVDVRDAASAVVGLATSTAPAGSYNVATGFGRKVADAVGSLIDLSQVPVTVRSLAQAGSDVDVPSQTGSNEHLRRVTGWEPSISFESSLHDLMDSWREQLSNVGA